MDVFLQNIDPSSLSWNYINAQYQIFGEFQLRSKNGKDTRCDFWIRYYDNAFHEVIIDLHNNKHIRSKTLEKVYQSVAEKLKEELACMPILNELIQEDMKKQVPTIDIVKKEILKGDRRLLHILLNHDETVKMWIDKVNGNWKYGTNAFFDGKYPSNIRSQMYNTIQTTKPFRNYFSF